MKHVRWPARLLEKAESAVNSVTLLCTLMALAFWLFLPVVQMVGKQSKWWLLAGPLIVMCISVVFSMWEHRQEIGRIPVVATCARLLSLVRDLLALLVIGGIFRQVIMIQRAGNSDLGWGTICDFLKRIFFGG